MVNRYSITTDAQQVAKRFSLDVPDGYKPNFNAAPTQLLPVITQGSQGISFFYWGATPAWANKKSLGEKIVNAALEVLDEKPVMRKKMKTHRCLIPADGYYAWKRIGKRSTIPYRLTLQDKEPFAIAGLWEEYDDENGDRFHTFSMITTLANDSVVPIDSRMPVILDPQHETRWLSEDHDEGLVEMLKAYNPTLYHYSVSPMINSPDRNDRTLVLPAPASDQYGNLTLFD